MQGKKSRYVIHSLELQARSTLFARLFYVLYNTDMNHFAFLSVYMILCCALIISAFVDLELSIIPNEVTFVGIPLLLIFKRDMSGLHKKYTIFH